MFVSGEETRETPKSIGEPGRGTSCSRWVLASQMVYARYSAGGFLGSIGLRLSSRK